MVRHYKNLIFELYLIKHCRTCGGGGASGVMLANRLSPTTSRRPTLNPSSRYHNRNKNHGQINNRYQKDCGKKELCSIGQEKSSNTCTQNFELEDEKIRPPTFNSSSDYAESHPSFNSSSSSNTSLSSVRINILENKTKSFDDTCETFFDSHLETSQRRRLVPSTTRYFHFIFIQETSNFTLYTRNYKMYHIFIF